MIIFDILVPALIVLIFIAFAGMGPAGLLGVILFPYVLAFGASYLVIRIINIIFRNSPLNEFAKLSIFKLIFIIAVVYLLISSSPFVILGGVFVTFGVILLCYLLACLLFWLTRRIFPKIWFIVIIILLIAGVIFAQFAKGVKQSEGSRITIEELKKAEYFIPRLNKTIKMTDKAYRINSNEYVDLDFPYVAFGDVNNDGKEDAALLIDYIGKDVFEVYLVVMLNSDGKPLYLTGKSMGVDINFNGISNVQVQSIKINSGIITTEIDFGSPRDVFGTRKVFKHKLSGDQLVDVQ